MSTVETWYCGPMPTVLHIRQVSTGDVLAEVTYVPSFGTWRDTPEDPNNANWEFGRLAMGFYIQDPQTSTYSSEVPENCSGDPNFALINFGAYGDLEVISAEPAAVPPSITSSLTAGGTVGLAFSYQATADGDATIAWSATGLPAGLSLDEETGALTGTPTTAAVTNVDLVATNSGGTDEIVLVITILAAAAPGLSAMGGLSGLSAMTVAGG